MLPAFQRAYWESKFRQPDWYRQLEQELREYIFSVVHDDPPLKAWRHQVYTLAGEMLTRGEIPLARTGPDLDKERRSPDTIVIHHTEEDAAISLAKLNAIGLLRQYGLHYLEKPARERKPVWSGHFRQGRMVFFAYHWLVRPDGFCERLLEDRAIGWHAGNWEINTRSIAIALSGNYEHAAPPAEQIEAAAQLINEQYSSVARERVLGHCEIRPDLTCPGDHFLNGWKEQLVQKLRT